MSTAVGVSLPRLSTVIGKALSKYAIEKRDPKLVADFYDEYYRANGGKTSFDGLITHSIAGNATMTDGYGPELVTNGSFDDGTTGWAVAGTSCTLSYEDGRAKTVCTGTDGNSRIGQSVGTLTAGVTYVFSLQYYEASSYGFIRVTSGGIAGTNVQQVANTTNNGARSVTMYFTPTTTQQYFVVAGGNFTTGSISTFDNVSVREMPVIKWAPHNLLSYSEDFTQANWQPVTTTVTANQATAPDGTLTADKVTVNSASISYLRDFLQIDAHRYTFGIFAKAGTTSNIQLYIIQQGVTSGTADIDLSDGTVSSVAGVFTGGVTATDVGDGWYLIEGVRTFTASAPNHGVGVSATGQNGLDFYIWGAHLYRSDLGGMAGNPDQPPSRTSYVPTTSAAKYLPRRGHHVFNGYEWVNEGCLVESEARTNLAVQSHDFSTSWSTVNASITSDDAVGPDGLESADFLVPNTTNAQHRVDLTPTSSAGTQTFSVYVKEGGYSYVWLRIGLNGAGFDLTDASNFSVSVGITPTIQEVGNGWYRCAITTTSASANDTLRINVNSTATLNDFAGDGTSGVYIYGAQLEAASTPSSYIPTSGATATRTAETMTIPSANLPWPTPEYIGSELFDSPTLDGSGTITDVGGGVYDFSWTSGATASLVVADVLTLGNVYEVRFTMSNRTSGSIAVSLQAFGNGGTFNADGTYTVYVVAASGDDIRLDRSGTNGSLTLSNISVREINPLALTITMDGRVTYADTGSFVGSQLYRWLLDGDNFLDFIVRSDAALGNTLLRQEANNVRDEVPSTVAVYLPDVLVPFNIAGRHGTTFLNSADDGTARSVNTTPVALPDLSASDLDLAYNFMGTVKSFSIWDKDLGDAGIVKATEPELEPSLLLSFETRGTSYVVTDWSE